MYNCRLTVDLPGVWIVQIVMIVLKVSNLVDYSWIVTFIPLWTMMGVFALMGAAYIIALSFEKLKLWGKRNSK